MQPVSSEFGQFCRSTHSTHGPKDTVVDKKPTLLGESSQVLALGDTTRAAQRRKHVLHAASAEASEEDDEEGDEVGIIGANGIVARLGVEIREVEEFVGMRAGLGDKGVGEEEQGEEVRGEA